MEVYHPSETVQAIQDLEVAVVTAFSHHDRDLRAEVERVNRQVRWLIGAILLVGAAIIFRRKN